MDNIASHFWTNNLNCSSSSKWTTLRESNAIACSNAVALVLTGIEGLSCVEWSGTGSTYPGTVGTEGKIVSPSSPCTNDSPGRFQGITMSGTAEHDNCALEMALCNLSLSICDSSATSASGSFSPASRAPITCMPVESWTIIKENCGNHASGNDANVPFVLKPYAAHHPRFQHDPGTVHNEIGACRFGMLRSIIVQCKQGQTCVMTTLSNTGCKHRQNLLSKCLTPQPLRVITLGHISHGERRTARTWCNLNLHTWGIVPWARHRKVSRALVEGTPPESIQTSGNMVLNMRCSTIAMSSCEHSHTGKQTGWKIHLVASDTIIRSITTTHSHLRGATSHEEKWKGSHWDSGRLRSNLTNPISHIWGDGFTGSRMYLPNQDPSEQNFDPRWLWCTHLHPHAHCIAEPTAGQLAHLVGHLVNITPNIDEFHTHSMERERVEEQVSEVRTSSTRRKSLPLEMAAHPMNHGEQEHSLTCHVHIAAWHVVPTLTFVTCCAHIGIHAHHCSGFFHTGT